MNVLWAEAQTTQTFSAGERSFGMREKRITLYANSCETNLTAIHHYCSLFIQMTSVQSVSPAMIDACTQTPFPGSEETLDSNPFVRYPTKTSCKRARDEYQVCTLLCHQLARPAPELRPAFVPRAGGGLAIQPQQRSQQEHRPIRRGSRSHRPPVALRGALMLLRHVGSHHCTCNLLQELRLLALLLGSPVSILGSEECSSSPLIPRWLLGLRRRFTNNTWAEADKNAALEKRVVELEHERKSLANLPDPADSHA